jgi:O-antigen/teichoic acid export membrane protein
MYKLKQNIASNLIAKLWISASRFLMIPIYIKFIGVEAYGLIGIYESLMSLTALLDMGFSSALTRELAYISVLEDKAQESGNLVRSLEVIYWIIAVLIILVTFGLSSPFIDYWINTKGISRDIIGSSTIFMGLTIAFRFPFFLYYGGLLGLQKQFLVNSIVTVLDSLRVIGIILIFWLASPTIQSFFIWQSFISLLQTFVTAIFLWKSLPKTFVKSNFDIKSLQKISKFATGMIRFSISGAILLQMDNIVLSKILTLESFGYYSLALTLGYIPHYLLMYPIYTAIFPMFSELISRNDEVRIISLYHKITQLTVVLLLSVTLTLSLFSYEIFYIWVRSDSIASHAYWLVSLISLGTFMHSIVHIPYAIQFAYGKTKLVIWTNITSLLILFPILIILVQFYGALGGPIVWILMNLGNFLIMVQLMHQDLLITEKKSWYCNDLLLPSLITIPLAILMRVLLPSSASFFFTIAWLLLTAVILFIAGAAVSPLFRGSFYKLIKK